MSLVFIASLVALAQRRNDIGSILRNLQGGDYPMIMDSPFGQLGGNFRSSIAHHVPALAPQCIVLVSSSQYEGEVEKELGASDRIGKRYLLIYKGPSKKDEAKDQVAINGIQYTVYHEDQNEHTHLEEI
jgi:DNA sulfur modification protein DndD